MMNGYNHLPPFGFEEESRRDERIIAKTLINIQNPEGVKGL